MKQYKVEITREALRDIKAHAYLKLVVRIR